MCVLELENRLKGPSYTMWVAGKDTCPRNLSLKLRHSDSLLLLEEGPPSLPLPCMHNRACYMFAAALHAQPSMLLAELACMHNQACH